MSNGGTDNPGFCYWLIYFNNIAINLNTSTLYFFSACMEKITVRLAKQ